ncbi:MAG: hypothetical protein ACE5DM_01020, partial [Candidatus Nanoarchaeia archaeon]
MRDVEFSLKRYDLTKLVFVAVFFVLFVPVFMRLYAGNTSAIGSESYLNMRYAQDLIDSKTLDFDELVEKYELTPDLVYSRRTFHFNPYHVLFAFLGNFFGLRTVAQILPILLGIFSILLFSNVLDSLKFEKSRRDIILLLAVTSPAFIYAFTVATTHSLAIVLSMLSILLFTKKDYVWFVGSMVCLFLVSLFSVFNLIVLLACLLAYAIHDSKKKSWFFMALLISMFFLFIKQANIYYSYTTHESLQFFTAISSDLGGLIGFGFVSLLLMFLGLGRLWKNRKQLFIFLIPASIIASYVYVGEGFFMYLSFFVAIAAGDGLLLLVERKWHLHLLKGLTLIILVCGIIFSVVSYADRMIEADPHPETLHSLELLQKASKGGEIVLTH